MHNNPSKPFFLDLGFNVFREVKSIKMRISIEVYLNDTNLQLQLVNQTVDVCRSLKHCLGNWQVKLLLGNLDKYPGIPRECPVKPGIYYANNYTVELKFLPMKKVRAHKFFSTFELFTVENRRYLQLTQMKFDGSIANGVL